MEGAHPCVSVTSVRRTGLGHAKLFTEVPVLPGLALTRTSPRPPLAAFPTRTGTRHVTKIPVESGFTSFHTVTGTTITEIRLTVFVTRIVAIIPMETVLAARGTNSRVSVAALQASRAAVFGTEWTEVTSGTVRCTVSGYPFTFIVKTRGLTFLIALLSVPACHAGASTIPGYSVTATCSAGLFTFVSVKSLNASECTCSVRRIAFPTLTKRTTGVFTSRSPVELSTSAKTVPIHAVTGTDAVVATLIAVPARCVVVTVTAIAALPHPAWLTSVYAYSGSGSSVA